MNRPGAAVRPRPFGRVPGLAAVTAERAGGVFLSLLRWPYLAAVALIAAAVSDLMVEAIANTGAFGPGFFDTDDSSIVPSLIVAMLLAAGVIVSYMQAACRRSRVRRRDWLANAAQDVATHAPLRDIPAVSCLQFAALFAMESIEQVVARGHVLGGSWWLGGPPVTSVALHVSVGVACTLVAGWLMRLSAPHFAALVCTALAFVPSARSIRDGVYVVRRDAASCNHAQAVRVGHISGRAPPQFPTPA